MYARELGSVRKLTNRGAVLRRAWYLPTNVRLAFHLFVWWGLGALVLGGAEPPSQHFIGQLSDRHYFEENPGPIEVGGFTIHPDDAEEEITIQGRDLKGKPWTVNTRMGAGIGFSVGWLADLDGDGQQDLILNHIDPRSGRCTSGSFLTTIMRDDLGRPIPWDTEGYYLVDIEWDPPSHEGVLDWADHDGDGGVELVFRDCYSYSYQSEPYQVHGLVDVYEARSGYWRRLSTTERAERKRTYLEVVQREHQLRPRPEDMGAFIPDYSNDWPTGRKTTIANLMPRQKDCGGVRFPPFEMRNGQIRMAERTEEWERQNRERCEDRFVLSDGTDCYGKPAIVIHRVGETEAFLNDRSDWPKELVEEIIEEKLPVVLTGQLREGLCSPAMIWARERLNR